MNISNWYDVYPKGTIQGDVEEKLFKSLARNKKWKWRSVSAIAKESGISEEEVEKILDKYYKLNMVFQNPSSDTQWAYWTNVPDLINKPIESILSHDHKLRLKGIQDFIIINVENKDDFEDENSDVVF
jgi:hypothetical protein